MIWYDMIWYDIKVKYGLCLSWKLIHLSMLIDRRYCRFIFFSKVKETKRHLIRSMKRKNEKGNESSRLLQPFTHVFVRTPVVPSTVPFRTPGTVPNAVREISPRSSWRTEGAAEIESITSEAAVRLFVRRFIWARHSSVLQTRKETSYFSCVSRYFPGFF